MSKSRVADHKNCACGCGALTSGGDYRPGHDAKHLSNLWSMISIGWYEHCTRVNVEDMAESARQSVNPLFAQIIRNAVEEIPAKRTALQAKLIVKIGRQENWKDYLTKQVMIDARASVERAN